MNKSKNALVTSPVVFYTTAITTIIFVTAVIMIGAPANKLFSGFQGWMSVNFGWFINLVVNYSLFFILLMLVSNKFGNIRLGGKDTLPEFSRISWVSMLFSAGMGIGLLYFSVAEPMYHYSNPTQSTFTNLENMQQAMNITFYHYGFHVWALYAVVGLCMAYFCFSKSKPLSISSTLLPIIPKKFHLSAPLIDALASIATLFGLATSLGFGARQFCAGLEEIFNIPNTQSTQVVAITIITMIATVSIITGLKKGVKILSNLNMFLALLLFLFVLFAGPTVKMLDFTIESFGSYLQNIVGLSFSRGQFSDSAGFYKGWSMFYWAWWISWSPFVGTFIARISKGRTIREFIFFVLLAPSVISFIWLAVFGGNAFDQQAQGLVDFTQIIQNDSSKALFAMLNNLPLKTVSSLLSILLVATFFITSSDSGSLVVDFMTSGGKIDTPTVQKIFWASMEGLIAIALILGGGLSALQAASISTGFPFALILILMTISLYKSLKEDDQYK